MDTLPITFDDVPPIIIQASSSLIKATSTPLYKNLITATSTVDSMASDLYVCRQQPVVQASYQNDSFYRDFYVKIRMLLL
jgi:hypothetical protein